MTMRCCRDCPAGEQLLEDYGDNTDRIYLQYHGFVADNNPFRCVQIAPPVKENISSEQTRALLDALQFKQTPGKCLDTSGMQSFPPAIVHHPTCNSTTHHYSISIYRKLGPVHGNILCGSGTYE
jgi:hypothetical protein